MSLEKTPGWWLPSTCPSTIAGPTSPGAGESRYQAACVGVFTEGTEIWLSLPGSTVIREDLAPIPGISTEVGRKPANGFTTGTEVLDGAGSSTNLSPIADTVIPSVLFVEKAGEGFHD
ncbi:hypothetical protein ATK36_3321 [Amycolatopsis sulphurea]|uniref:Uncharacterized protein n=1 Tax=Amycolatopsis sulphurea TaxID=76022 RepID=A0A2A9FCG0_9PSEU|nr:hypothetical protein ATK36_3321 [Amycolatopsis sulphurea]